MAQESSAGPPLSGTISEAFLFVRQLRLLLDISRDRGLRTGRQKTTALLLFAGLYRRSACGSGSDNESVEDYRRTTASRRSWTVSFFHKKQGHFIPVRPYFGYGMFLVGAVIFLVIDTSAHTAVSVRRFDGPVADKRRIAPSFRCDRRSFHRPFRRVCHQPFLCDLPASPGGLGKEQR